MHCKNGMRAIEDEFPRRSAKADCDMGRRSLARKRGRSAIRIEKRPVTLPRISSAQPTAQQVSSSSCN
jgi:hypothetical protein